jgi:hypothetical protein
MIFRTCSDAFRHADQVTPSEYFFFPKPWHNCSAFFVLCPSMIIDKPETATQAR